MNVDESARAIRRVPRLVLSGIILVCLVGSACKKHSTEETVTTEANRATQVNSQVVSVVQAPVRLHRRDAVELLGDRLAALTFLIQTGRRDVSLRSLSEIEALTKGCLAASSDGVRHTALQHTYDAEVRCERLIRQGDLTGARTECRHAVSELDVVLSPPR